MINNEKTPTGSLVEKEEFGTYLAFSFLLRNNLIPNSLNNFSMHVYYMCLKAYALATFGFYKNIQKCSM